MRNDFTRDEPARVLPEPTDLERGDSQPHPTLVFHMGEGKYPE